MIIIIGAGIYGSLAAIKLADTGYDIQLYDKSEILGGSTKYNMWRIHNGYQYPGKDCMNKSHETYKQFIDMFPSAITKTRTYYMIANDSKISASQYIQYLDNSNLLYKFANKNVTILLKNYQLINDIPSVFEVDEVSYDPIILQQLITEKIITNKNITFINKEYDVNAYNQDNIIINTVPTTDTSCYEIIYGYLPLKYKDLCVVVMDGPFMTINTYSNTGMHAIYHVVHSNTNVPESFINKDIDKSEYSKYLQIVDSCKNYFTDFDFTYVGSTFTKKLTNPYCPKCRHGCIKRANNVINCFPGKVGEAIHASDCIVRKIKEYK